MVNYQVNRKYKHQIRFLLLSETIIIPEDSSDTLYFETEVGTNKNITSKNTLCEESEETPEYELSRYSNLLSYVQHKALQSLFISQNGFGYIRYYILKEFLINSINNKFNEIPEEVKINFYQRIGTIT